jgi:hypothetical protein
LILVTAGGLPHGVRNSIPSMMAGDSTTTYFVGFGGCGVSPRRSNPRACRQERGWWNIATTVKRGVASS